MAQEPEDITTETTPVEPATETPVEATDSNAEEVQVKEPATDTEADTGESEAVKSEEEPKEGEPAEEVEQPSEDDKAARKRHNDEMARQRIAQSNQKTRQDVLKQVDEVYGPAEVEAPVLEGLSPAEAKIAELQHQMEQDRAQREFEKQRNFVADLNTGLKNDAELVMRDHPVFDENSPEYDAEFAKKVESNYKKAARLEIDSNGIVINAEIPLGEFYAEMAEIRNAGIQKGEVKRQKDTQTMVSRTESTGSTKTTSSDKPFSDLSIEEMEAKLGVKRV